MYAIRSYYVWDARVPDGMGHIELSRDRDLVVVAPASADFIAKVANGLANDLLKEELGDNFEFELFHTQALGSYNFV